MAGLTEEDIKNLKALSDVPRVDPLTQSPSKQIEMEEVETLGGTIQKRASKNTGMLEEGLGADIVAEQEYLPEKILAGGVKALTLLWDHCSKE